MNRASLGPFPVLSAGMEPGGAKRERGGRPVWAILRPGSRVGCGRRACHARTEHKEGTALKAIEPGSGSDDAAEIAAAEAEARVPLWGRPGFLVRRLHQIHSALFLEECKAFNITPVQYGLMSTLLQHSGSDQRSLGVEIGIDRTNVADVLERLAERGLVRRERSETDRRSMNAYLTDEGRELVEQMYASMTRAQQRLLEPLAPEFRPAFLAMLTQLVEGNNKYSRAELRIDFKGRKGARRKSAEDD